MFAHAQVRSGKDGALSWSKCLMPIVDSQNHEPAPLSAAARATLGAEWSWLAGADEAGGASDAPGAAKAWRAARGPATAVEFAGGGARWVATRDIAAGEQVTWRCARSRSLPFSLL